MSRKERHLEPVPPAAEAPYRSTTERIELPTGGRPDADGLLRELASVAFRGALTGFAVELDRTGLRCFATVRTHKDFGPEQVAAGEQTIIRALLALGVVKPAAPAPDSDGDKSPTLPQSPPASAD